MDFKYRVYSSDGRFDFEVINTKRFKVSQKASMPDISKYDRKGHAFFTKIYLSTTQQSSAVVRVSFSFVSSGHKSRKK